MPINNNILAGSGQSSADLGDKIDQSLRFEGGQFLRWNSDTQAGDDRTQWTHSMWVKLAQVGVEDCLFSGWQNSNNRFELTLRTTGQLEVAEWGAGSTKEFRLTNGVFRDHSAWYHLVIVYDVDNSTDADKLRLYINGKRETSFSSETSTAGWAGVFGDSGTDAVYGGKWNGSSITNGFDGYIALPIMLDGILVSEDADGYITEFGRLNSDGVWVPEDYTGSYGTNGWKLTLDSSQTNSIGEDSGNNNDFTDSSFDKAAISSSNEDNDIDYNDTPTNNYATLNPLNVFDAGVTYSKANLRANYGGLGNRVVFVDMPMADGKYYWELTLKDQVEGWAGVITEDYVKRQLTNFADNSDSWAYNLSGSTDNQKRHNDSNSSSHGATVAGDTIGFLLDIASGTLEIEINGTTQSNSEFTNIPTSKRLFVAFNIGGGSGNVNMDWNFGQMPFVHTQTGYNDVATNNLPAPTIKNGKDYFDVVQYQGSTSSNPVVNSLEFQPDFVWIKRTNNTNSHHLVNSVMGDNLALASDLTNDEFASGVVSLDSNGFTIDSTGGNAVSANGDTYTAWCWKAGGTAVSNTDGTITSSVSANTDAGFSIVTYTGTNVSGQSFGHGLTKAPEFIIIKSRDLVDSIWAVYHPVLGQMPVQSHLTLNTDAAINTVGADTFVGVNASTLSVGSFGFIGSTQDYVAYCWHSVEGYSKIGSYTGNGDADGPFIWLGFRPSFFLHKRTDAGDSNQNWRLWDSTRGTSNPVNIWLQPNTDDVENSSSAGAMDFLSNGVKVRATDTSNNNASGASYIYMAFAENPFGGENAPPVTAR